MKAILNFSSKQEMKTWVLSLKNDIQRPCVILLSGEMGAGKTQVVSWLLSTFGINDVASPTFAVLHRYTSADGTSIDHADLFRLSDQADLESSGFLDLFMQTSGLVIVEWANRLSESEWPQKWQKLFIHIKKTQTEEGRTVSFKQI